MAKLKVMIRIFESKGRFDIPQIEGKGGKNYLILRPIEEYHRVYRLIIDYKNFYPKKRLYHLSISID